MRSEERAPTAPAARPALAPGSGHPAGALRHVVEQLWAPVLASGEIRVATGPDAEGDGWTDVERYLALPSVETATMLLPAASREVLAGSLLSFRRLRMPAPRLQRSLLGRMAGAGLPLPFPAVRVQARSGPGERALLPTERIARDLGVARLHAAIGVRTGGNRKATLSLVDDDGAPAGFAKFSWEALSAAGVTREADALTALMTAAGGSGAVGAPRLLARGSWHGWPYLVTEPLPADSTRLRGDDLPSAQEIFALAPVVRTDRLAATRQFSGLRERVATLAAEGRERELVGRVAELLDRIAGSTLPVAARWHGDLTPWNCARDGRGRLWCWDWESSEPDVAAGLDAIHWAATTRTLRGERYGGRLLAAAAEEALPILVAAGHSRATRTVVPALYAATLVERAVDLAACMGRWYQDWLLPDEARDLLEAGHVLAGTAP
ncbi:hypothetical protein [Nocardioides humi]|uniref:Phosphotransferase enzyme family protein n=1 Tax=Nocardioides humi TaxID=449461 RepID=A0ABN2AYD9_9ACTN|nr:hypothetical protein [Nocardioides humi]